MAASPGFKLYDAEGVYQASAKEVEFLAAGIGFYGDGSTIRSGHLLVIWTEGTDGRASDSFDVVAQTAYNRLAEEESRIEAKRRRAMNHA